MYKLAALCITLGALLCGCPLGYTDSDPIDGCDGDAAAPLDGPGAPGERCDPKRPVESCEPGSVCNTAGVCTGGIGCTTPGAEGISCGDGGICRGGICRERY